MCATGYSLVALLVCTRGGEASSVVLSNSLGDGERKASKSSARRRAREEKWRETSEIKADSRINFLLVIGCTERDHCGCITLCCNVHHCYVHLPLSTLLTRLSYPSPFLLSLSDHYGQHTHITQGLAHIYIDIYIYIERQ